jgi:hypothetical protein
MRSTIRIKQGQGYSYKKAQDIKHGILYKNMDKYPSTVINAKAALTTVLKHRLFYVSLALFCPISHSGKSLEASFLVNSSGTVVALFPKHSTSDDTRKHPCYLSRGNSFPRCPGGDAIQKRRRTKIVAAPIRQ